MKLPVSYTLRYLIRRKVTSFLTLCGVALVVVVYSSTLMLSKGLEKTLSATGSMDNVIIIRNGAENEIQSSISREEAGVVLSHPSIKRLDGNKPFVSSNVIVLVSLKKRESGDPSNVTVRGVSPLGLELQPELRVVEGRVPARGTREVMVGTAVRRRFLGTERESTLRLSGADWKIVGIFDAGDTAFNSEVWGDVDIMMPAFKRDSYSSIVLKLNDDANFERMKQDLQGDRRLSVKVEREREFYELQSKILAKFIRFLGTFVSIVFSMAAVIGCMITMYGAVSQRMREVGILRALGFTRIAILSSFVIECALLSLGGGIMGLVIASFLAGHTFSTTNFQTFADLTFRFTITPGIAMKCMLFALIMGLLGGILPAWHASRVKVVEAVRVG